MSSTAGAASTALPTADATGPGPDAPPALDGAAVARAALAQAPGDPAAPARSARDAVDAQRDAADALAAQARAAAGRAAGDARETAGAARDTARAAPSPAAATTGMSAAAAQVVELTNAERRQAGCPALRADARITAAAQGHSEDMAEGRYFDHSSQDGRDFADRMTASGYDSPGAENIAQGQPDAASVVAAWMDSPGHRRNILDCSLSTIGVGLSDGYWTQNFGR
ncbi:CAP domain-containing protein [Pseudonocardia sp. HH130630-07]|uniref:CAP domain-containing protein n=1 Tax=Pseudonocardia sp. HH130630-07 TaxID=1690815 RepID=UPI001E4FE124|nr:CAP domain-containing protein [Pseudonocardia sp. HH130630-07]